MSQPRPDQPRIDQPYPDRPQPDQPQPGPPQPDLPEDLTCSARGCVAPATTDVRWNNAKIHTPERRKHWLACPDHEASLSAYLSARGMLREVVPLEV